MADITTDSIITSDLGKDTEYRVQAFFNMYHTLNGETINMDQAKAMIRNSWFNFLINKVGIKSGSETFRGRVMGIINNYYVKRVVPEANGRSDDINSLLEKKPYDPDTDTQYISTSPFQFTTDTVIRDWEALCRQREMNISDFINKPDLYLEQTEAIKSEHIKTQIQYQNYNIFKSLSKDYTVTYVTKDRTTGTTTTDTKTDVKFDATFLTDLNLGDACDIETVLKIDSAIVHYEILPDNQKYSIVLVMPKEMYDKVILSWLQSDIHSKTVINIVPEMAKFEKQMREARGMNHGDAVIQSAWKIMLDTMGNEIQVTPNIIIKAIQYQYTDLLKGSDGKYKWAYFMPDCFTFDTMNPNNINAQFFYQLGKRSMAKQINGIWLVQDVVDRIENNYIPATHMYTNSTYTIAPYDFKRAGLIDIDNTGIDFDPTTATALTKLEAKFGITPAIKTVTETNAVIETNKSKKNNNVIANENM